MHVDTAIGEHIGQLRQRVTDADAEVFRLQISLEEMRSNAEEQATAAVDCERQKLQEEFVARLETVTQERE